MTSKNLEDDKNMIKLAKSQKVNEKEANPSIIKAMRQIWQTQGPWTNQNKSIFA